MKIITSKILTSLGLFLILKWIWENIILELMTWLRSINQQMDTSLISPAGYEALNNPAQMKNIGKAIDFYQKYGVWHDDLLRSDAVFDFAEKEKEIIQYLNPLQNENI